MANLTIRAVGYFTDTNNKTLPMGERQFNLIVAALNDPSVTFPDPASINTVLTNNGLMPVGAAKFVVTDYANLDRDNNQGLYS